MLKKDHYNSVQSFNGLVMKILIIGAGEAGQYLAGMLSGEGHEIVMIDRDPERLALVEDSLDIKTVQGHGAAAGVLEQAGAWGSDLVLAVTNNDEVNMLAAFLAKTQGAGRTIVRIRGGEHLHFHRHFYKRTMGFDSILVPNELCAQEIMELIRARQAVAVENFADGQIQMRQVQVTGDSQWSGQALSRIKMPRRTLVTAIIRGPEIYIPDGESEIKADDELLVIGKKDSMDELDKFAQRRKAAKAKLVIIVGGGELGLSVAHSLDYSDIKTRLIEDDQERARVISEELENVMVVHGDGTDLDLLKETGTDHADVFISSCAEDEKNLMICQLAKNLGADKTIALVKKPDYVPLYQQLGIDSAISPRLLVAQRILRFVRRGAVTSIAVIAEGKAEVIELKASEGSKITGTPLHRIGFPKGAIIGSVVRGDKVYIPDGDFQIEPDDSCVVFTFLSTLSMVEKLFQGKKKNLIANLKGNHS